MASHLERGLLGLGVIGYQYILLIAQMKARWMCHCLLSVSSWKRYIETGTDSQCEDKDRQLMHVDMEPVRSEYR